MEIFDTQNFAESLKFCQGFGYTVIPALLNKMRENICKLCLIFWVHEQLLNIMEKASEAQSIMLIGNSYNCMIMAGCACFPSVPSSLIKSVSLSPPNPIGTVGSSVSLICTAILSVDVSGAMIVFDYGFRTSTMAAVAGSTQTDIATISPVEVSSSGDYTCTVTVIAPGVCGGGGPACPTNTSDAVPLIVQDEL